MSSAANNNINPSNEASYKIKNDNKAEKSRLFSRLTEDWWAVIILAYLQSRNPKGKRGYLPLSLTIQLRLLWM
jgi:hypothetical protein